MTRVRGAWVVVAVLLGPAPFARAADAEPTGPAPAGKQARDDGRRTVRRLPVNLALGTIGVFDWDNATPFLLGSVATSSASFFDQNVRDSVHGNDPGNDWGDAFQTGAGPVWNAVFVGSMFTAGRLSDGPRFRAMSYDMLDAAIVNVGYTELLKVVAQRERPDGVDHKSFPSGHTSSAFALATVAERHYGWKLGVPAYLVAGLVGASRLHQDKHYLSDVMAGATLGYLVGRTVVRVNGRPLGGGTSRRAAVHVAPIVSRQARGLQMSVLF